ncbi:Cytochrome c551 peroxidase precursor [Gimesia panareensis]|uniref:Cytochrome c551 peroxidase n=1 Tax=Gimesia panareensis TaxID=2527978 RepID=A0A518FMN5_9PLAN|nr:cytochrome c peroxidase [Gimesia panareensis]QDV17626.1 Cytochrome c551 peroxidase precursor [Gimesia panareensis]
MKVSEHRSYPLLLKLSVVTAMFMGLTCAQSGTAQAAEKKSNKVQLGTDELTLGVPGKGPLTNAEIKEWLDNPENHQILEVTLPLGLSAGQAQMKGLKENPLTRAKVELGRQLYFDTRLSSDNTISCASCHHPDEGWGRHTQFGIGVRDQEGGRNSPISYNRILSGPQFWDGRAATLEAQAVGPIANPIEMANTHENAVKTLKKIPGYQMQFKKIFKDGVTIDNVGKAIAAFERAVVTGPSPFDYQEQLKPFLKLDKEDLEDLKEEYEPALAMANKHPMSKSAKRGMDLFFSEKVNCAACHLGPNLADEKYHNLGVGMDAKKPDLGRYEVTKAEKDKGAFKTPTIRNVALSAPYMHDGSLQTLEEVVEHYNKGGTPNPWLSEKVKKLNLSDQDKKDLVAFMKACTGPFPKVETGRLPE